MLRCRGHRWGVAIAVAAASAFAAPAAHADTTGTFWSCRASAVYVQGLGQRTEPTAANPTSPLCATAAAGPITADIPVAGVARVRATSLARTTISPAVGATRGQTAVSNGSAENISLSVLSAHLTVTRAQASATARCRNGVPSLSSAGSVDDIRLNGVQIVPRGTIEVVGNVINGLPLGAVLRISTNEVAATGTAGTPSASLVRRALHVRLLQGTTLRLDAVLAEASVGRSGSVCAAPPTLANPCPAGTTYDQARGVCAIVAGGPGGGGTRVIVVGRPGSLAIGGRVVVLDDWLRTRQGRPYRHSPCAGRGFGRRLAVVGTNHADRISGSRGADRIFALGGSDTVSGALGNDCVEAGTGQDRVDGGDGNDTLLGGLGSDSMDGSRGNDRMLGGGGLDRIEGGRGNDRIDGGGSRDTIEGGAGNDRLLGRAGNDYLSGGPGNDALYGGSGKDAINVGSPGVKPGFDRASGGAGSDVIVATGFGARARIDGGAGFDTARITAAERRSTRHCERIQVLRTARRA